MTQTLQRTGFGYEQHDSGFHVGTKPWYAVGTQLLEKAPTVEEGIKLAGLDWNVELKPLQTEDGITTDLKGVVRTDINEILGVVTNKYQPLQNVDAFKFFQEFIDNGLATLDSAGSFHNGKRVWILAKINREDMIIDEKNDDRVEKYILLSNSYNGKTAVRIGYTPIRVSCMNTLSAAHNNSKSQLIKVYHRGNIVKTVGSLVETMNLIDQTFITTEEKYKQLAQMQIKKEDLQKYVKAVFSKKSLEELYDNETGFSEYETRQLRKSLMERVEEVFEMEYATNAWTAYNSVNNFICHVRGKDQTSGLNALWFESAKRLNERALEAAENIYRLPE